MKLSIETQTGNTIFYYCSYNTIQICD